MSSALLLLPKSQYNVIYACLIVELLITSYQNNNIMLLESIGKSIKIRRKELGLSQSILAELANISKNTIYKLERGSGNPSIKTLSELLKVLGLEILIEVKKN